MEVMQRVRVNPHYSCVTTGISPGSWKCAGPADQAAPLCQLPMCSLQRPEGTGGDEEAQERNSAHSVSPLRPSTGTRRRCTGDQEREGSGQPGCWTLVRAESGGWWGCRASPLAEGKEEGENVDGR